MWNKLIIILMILNLSCKKAVIEKPILKQTYIELKLNDTFVKNKYNKGEFRILSYLNDSVKKTPKDFKFASLFVTISSKNVEEVFEIECDTFYEKTEKLKDTMIIPFYVKSNLTGKSNFVSIVDIEYILNATKFKDTSKRKVIKDRYTVTKPVYIFDK